MTDKLRAGRTFSPLTSYRSPVQKIHQKRNILSSSGPLLSSPFLPQVKRALGLTESSYLSPCKSSSTGSVKLSACHPSQSSPGILPLVRLGKREHHSLSEVNSSMVHSPNTVKIAPPDPYTMSSPSRFLWLRTEEPQEGRKTPDTQDVVTALKERRKRTLGGHDNSLVDTPPQSKRRRQESQQSNASTSSLPPMPEIMPDLSSEGYSVYRLETPGLKRPALHNDSSTEWAEDSMSKRTKKDNRNNSIMSSLSSSRRGAEKESQQIKRKLTDKENINAKPKQQRRDSSCMIRDPPKNLERFRNSSLEKVAKEIPMAEISDSSIRPSSAHESRPKTPTNEGTLTKLHSLGTKRKNLSIYSSIHAGMREVAFANVMASLEDYEKDKEAEEKRVEQMLSDIADEEKSSEKSLPKTVSSSQPVSAASSLTKITSVAPTTTSALVAPISSSTLTSSSSSSLSTSSDKTSTLPACSTVTSVNSTITPASAVNLTQSTTQTTTGAAQSQFTFTPIFSTSSSSPATSTTSPNQQTLSSNQLLSVSTQPGALASQISSQQKTSTQTISGISLPSQNIASSSTTTAIPSQAPVLSALATAISPVASNAASSVFTASATTVTTAPVFSQLSNTQTVPTAASSRIANIGQPAAFDFGNVAPPPPYSVSGAGKKLSQTSEASTSFPAQPVSNSGFIVVPQTMTHIKDPPRTGIFGVPTSIPASTATAFGVPNTQTSNSAQSFVCNTPAVTFGKSTLSTSTPASVVSQTFGVTPTQIRQTPTFGTTPTQVSQAPVFGNINSQSNQATVFGIPPVTAQTSQPPAFGAAGVAVGATTQLNQASASIFGATATQASQAPTFAFGASASTSGQPSVQTMQPKEASAFSFGATQPNQTTAFGTQPNTSASLFGAAQTVATGIFGATQTPATQTPVFGTSQNATNRGAVFGTLQSASNQPPSFGTSQNSSFSVSQATTNQTQSFAFGGNNQPASVFELGKDPNQTTVSNAKKNVTFNFGATSQGNTTPVNQGTQNMFNTTNSQTAKNLFGASKTQSDSTGVFTLGQTSNTQTTQENTSQNGFAFGTPTGQTASSAVFAFGQNGTQQPTSNKGFDFSAAAGTANSQPNFGSPAFGTPTFGSSTPANGGGGGGGGMFSVGAGNTAAKPRAMTKGKRRTAKR
ncbi:hypothetical protein ScPMuIL_009541 [Solemya velum]